MTATKSPSKATKAEANGKAPAPREKKTGLRPVQVRVLKALASAKGPLSRPRLYEVLGFKNQSGLNDVVGRDDEATRKRIDAEKYPSLLSLGHIRNRILDVDGKKERVYEITASGKKAASKAPAE